MGFGSSMGAFAKRSAEAGEAHGAKSWGSEMLHAAKRAPGPASNRSLGSRLIGATKDVYNESSGFQQKAMIGAGVAGSVGLGAMAYNGAQDHPLGTGAAVLGTAAALALNPGQIGHFAECCQ
jgi:hypothetical protein